MFKTFVASVSAFIMVVTLGIIGIFLATNLAILEALLAAAFLALFGIAVTFLGYASYYKIFETIKGSLGE